MKRARKGRPSARGRTLAMLGALALAATSLGVWAAAKGSAPPPLSASTETAVPASTETPPPPQAKADTVRIVIQTVPSRKALVKWGRKTLGIIPAPKPLIVVRPRDSGPMDLVIRASGYLPVHTRAYTFNDSRVSVKLTPPEEKSKLFGYKQEPPPSPDAGVPVPEPAPPLPAPVGP